MSEIFNLEKIFDIFNYIFYFFVLNLFFMIFNIPVILFFVFVGISKITTYLPLFLVLSIPVAPAFTALLYCMRKLIENKSLNLFSDLKKGILLNFKQSTFIWILELIMVFALYSNIKFFSLANKNLFFVIISSIILILLALISPFIYILISRFSMKNLALIRSSFLLAFTKPILTITNLIIFLFTLVLFEIEPAMVALFIASITSYLIVFANKTLLADLEKKAKEVQ